MAAYETSTKLSMPATLTRAREFFEMEQGLEIRDRLGTQYRWRDPASGELIELRCFPIKGGGTRLEIDTRHNDAMVQEFIRDLPRPGLLDELRKRLEGKPGRGNHGSK